MVITKSNLHMRDLVLLPVVLLHLVLEQLHARAHERLVVTRVVLEPALAHVHDVGAHSVQEVLRVRYQDQDALVAAKILSLLLCEVACWLQFLRCLAKLTFKTSYFLILLDKLLISTQILAKTLILLKKTKLWYNSHYYVQHINTNTIRRLVVPK